MMLNSHFATTAIFTAFRPRATSGRGYALSASEPNGSGACHCHPFERVLVEVVVESHWDELTSPK
jgi:hypothetical protein